MIICLTLVILALASAVCLADSSTVTVSVRVARSIHVDGTATGRGSVRTVIIEGPGTVTFVAP